MTPTQTWTHILLDKSGSTDLYYERLIAAFNETINQIIDLQKINSAKAYRIGFSSFNHCLELHYLDRKPQRDLFLSDEDYMPEGDTAVWDAIVSTIRILESRHGPPVTEIMLIVISDCQDNASVNYDEQGARELMQQLEQNGGWSFLII
jgi:hypothetical protein